MDFMRVPWVPILLRTRTIHHVVPYSFIVQEIKTHQVEQAKILPENNIFVRMVDGTTQNSVLPDTSVVNLLLENNVPFAVEQKPPDVLGTIANAAFPIFLLFSFLTSRQSPLEIGKSKATVEMKETGVTFADVAGCDGSKLELQEVVDFLKNPEKYEAVGAKAPRGVLMEGPPGTGKTLLAKAVAGEAGVPFLSASGSEFVEMFVGVGASRVRDLFKKAKENAPCIVFIDEIDAVAKKRGGTSGGPRSGGNDEQEQTLNQILTEMDGFEGSSGVVVIAATNRADVLDAAILRPGRFDRRVPVDLPDRAGREAILKVHAKTRPLDATVDLNAIASRTTGFSGASLANVLNEAAIVAARRNKTDISIQEVDYALDRLTVGIEKPMTMSLQKKELVAYHEAGHAIMGLLTPGFDTISKVTIIPRSNAGGFTLFVPPEEEMYTKRYLESRIQVALGGRVAEELAFGVENTTTGASSDLQSVASLARTMVTQWGFSEELGPSAWEMPSEGTQELIDIEVQEIVEKAYKTCKQTLSANWGLVKKLVDLLLVEETVNAETLLQFVP